jgi:uncharacterized membrane protein
MLTVVRVPSALERLLVVAVVGAIAGAGVAFLAPWPLSPRRTRRTVLRHALLAYLFGAVILAVAVSVIAGLVND